jgi:putative ABC transport system substrate-binding protein
MNESRRRILTLSLGLTGLSSSPFAQQSGATRRIGILFPGKSEIVMPMVEAIRDGLKDLGWVEGRNIVMDLRVAEADLTRIDVLASELLAMKPELMVAGTTLVAQSLRRTDSRMPIVVGAASDPVGDGLVASLARPGGNTTGLSSYSAELSPKRLQLLRDFVPAGSRAAVLTDPATSFNARAMKDIHRIAPRVGLELVIVNATKNADVGPALARLSGEKVAGLLVMDNLLNTAHRREIAAAAATARIPLVSVSDVWTDTGALVTYGINYRAHWRRIAPYVNKILKGAKPADLPVEQPTTFELIVNLKTARAQGIKVPASVLARADRVID